MKNHVVAYTDLHELYKDGNCKCGWTWDRQSSVPSYNQQFRHFTQTTEEYVRQQSLWNRFLRWLRP